MVAYKHRSEQAARRDPAAFNNTKIPPIQFRCLEYPHEYPKNQVKKNIWPEKAKTNEDAADALANVVIMLPH